MTAIGPIPPAEPQHLVLHQVPWSFYERFLSAAAENHLQITFDGGSIEIMSPLPEHGLIREAIGSLLDVLAIERNIPMARFGSTTFRREDRLKGLEPDKCYYLRNAEAVRGMKRFDPQAYPAPDLAIEIDVTRRSLPREPVYAGLGVPELWRYTADRLTVLVLGPDNQYAPRPRSPNFPFLQISRLEAFIRRMGSEEQTLVLREFRDWVVTPPTG